MRLFLILRQYLRGATSIPRQGLAKTGDAMPNSAPSPISVLKKQRTAPLIKADLKAATHKAGRMFATGSTTGRYADVHREIDALLDELALCDLS